MSTIAERLGIGRRTVPGAFRGTRQRVDPGTRVCVIGGGIAGVSAACVLAERGAEVILIEREKWLGGRMGAWTERDPEGATFQLARSLPTIFRNYYNFRSILRRVDPELASLVAIDDHPVLGESGDLESFAGLPTTAPLNVLALFRRTPLVKLGDLRAMSGESFRAMLKFDPVRSYGELDGSSASAWLDRLALPPRARQTLFRFFSRSVFAREEDVSAAEMIARLHFYFLGNPEGMQFDVLEDSASDALWKPMERYLRRSGVDLRLGVSAARVDRDVRLGSIRVHVDGESEPIACDAVVLGLDVAGVRSLIEASPELRLDGGFTRSVESLKVSPPFALLRAYFDRRARPERQPYVHVAEGPLDTIALLDRIESESRRWARRHGGSVVQLQAVALEDAPDVQAVQRELVQSLLKLYPELEGARIVHEVLQVRADQPAFAPGSHATRPRVATPYGNVAMCGDYVKLPFPSALMERAATSGILAANQLLDRWDVRGEEVWSIPPRGFMAGVRFG